LKNLILTDQWERPYQPSIGGNVRKLLFAECSEQVANALQKRIEELIDNHEKRVVRQQIKVQANPTGRAYDIWIVYFELNNPSPTTFYIELKRTR
jgi:phage baseplate assembly protein W